MKLLDYHRLQSEEIAAWDRVQMEAEVRAQDPGFPERIKSLLPVGDYKTPTSEGSVQFQQLRELCEIWLRSTPEQRAFIRSQIDSTQAYLLGGFRKEAKRLAVEQNADVWLRLALASLAIGNLNSGDARDAIMSMNGLLVAARKTHADWGGLVRGVAALAGPGIAAILEDCLRNHPA
jgi:hypothetical protein